MDQHKRDTNQNDLKFGNKFVLNIDTSGSEEEEEKPNGYIDVVQPISEKKDLAHMATIENNMQSMRSLEIVELPPYEEQPNVMSEGQAKIDLE